jgi:hypothetical protein
LWQFLGVHTSTLDCIVYFVLWSLVEKVADRRRANGNTKLIRRIYSSAGENPRNIVDEVGVSAPPDFAVTLVTPLQYVLRNATEAI